MPARPRSINVCGRPYTVRTATLVNAYGECDGDAGAIRIDPAACNSLAAEQDTVLHEVLHAICRQQGRAYTKTEERFVTSITPGLLSVLRSNPALVAYLRS